MGKNFISSAMHIFLSHFPSNGCLIFELFGSARVQHNSPEAAAEIENRIVLYFLQTWSLCRVRSHTLRNESIGIVRHALNFRLYRGVFIVLGLRLPEGWRANRILEVMGFVYELMQDNSKTPDIHLVTLFLFMVMLLWRHVPKRTNTAFQRPVLFQQCFCQTIVSYLRNPFMNQNILRLQIIMLDAVLIKIQPAQEY